MALPVLVFLFVLTATFLLVATMTRPSPQERLVERRLAYIQMRRNSGGGPGEAAQFFKTETKSQLDWLNEMLTQFAWAQALKKQLLQANSATTVSGLLLWSFSVFTLGYAAAWLFAPMLVIDLAAGIALGLVPYGILLLRRSRRIKAFNGALAESIDMLARALRAGHSVAGGMEMLAQSAQEPVASEFSEVSKQQNLGLPLREAMMQLLDRVPSADLRVLVTAILVQKDTGGNLAEILDRTVFVIRERLRIQGEIQAQTAQGRLTGWILSSLPVAMLLLLNLVNPGYSRVLLTEPVGRKLIYGCVAMMAVGSWIIHRIVHGIEV
jgi:tight adherence protein B